MPAKNQRKPRGPNRFLRNDAVRAVASARQAGIEPTGLEIVTADGTTFRVFGAGAPQATPATGAADWNAATEKLKEQPRKATKAKR
jgi:hypothetical protein